MTALSGHSRPSCSLRGAADYWTVSCIARIESISRQRNQSERPKRRRSSPGPAPKKAPSDASIRDPKTRRFCR
jgi:hypothetical protein